MYEDNGQMYQWQALVAAPQVDQEDLRFNPDAEEVHSDTPGLTLLAPQSDGEVTRWIRQGPDGSREVVDDVHARFSVPVFRNQRTIRVFMSSTFRDMQVERNYLVTVVFPRLKRLAQSRGVLLQEIDLRWGITAEEAYRGETVAICLDEIDRCRACPPFFIGLLGERYGWIPDTAALDALDHAMGSRANGDASLEMRGRARRDAYSVTEMEIRYGVLDTPEMTGHAFFYNRAPELTRMFAQHTGELDAAPIYYEADAAGAARQEALKHALRERGLVRMDGYRSVQELGDDIEHAITAAIMRVARSVAAVQQQTAAPLPLGWQANQTLNDVMDAERVIFEQRDPQADAVTRAWADKDHPGNIRLMLVGPPGIGKAHEAMGLATLTRFWELGAPVIALHCRTGIVTNVDGAFGFIRSAMAAFSAIPASQPSGRTGLREVLQAIERPVILQITDIDLLGGATDLVDLLGLVQNPRLAIILTTTDAALGQRATGAFNVRPVEDLRPEERETFAREYLARYRKSLDTQAMHKLVSMPLAGSPFFLTLVLDELRHSALFETLDATLDVYAGMSTIEQAFLHSLQAWLGYVGAGHRDSDRWRGMLEVLCLARQGVPDDFFTASAGLGLSTLQWMTWQGLAEPALVDVGGSWRLRNPHLRDIVFKHCFGDDPDAPAQADTRRRLAAYIGAVPEPWDVTGLIERTQQMIWLATHAGGPDDVQGLYETLSVRNNIGALYVSNSGLLFEGWRVLVSKGFSLTPLIDMTVESTDSTWPYLLGRLLTQFECWADLERLARGVIAGQRISHAGDFDYQLAAALVNQGRVPEALDVIAPRIRAWADAPQAALPPTSLGILMGLIVDGEIDGTPWSATLDAALQALIEMTPSTDPELQLVLISCAMPLLLGTPHFTLTEALARRAMLMSYDFPGGEGGRVRLLMGFPLINALRSQSRFEEAVTAGFAMLATQTSSFPQEAVLRARCARATGQSLLGLARWDEAAELLEYALAHEPVDNTDFIPLLLNTAFLAICVIELKQWPRVRPLLEAFVAYGASLPDMRDELKGWLLQHLRNADQLDEARWLESACRPSA
ncbi:hypothetical protein ACS15_3256 [Ralstonia insidiosa]|uniref:DUF4062 domain-containing protein n=1 Tax=Ralstonia insidiosa TaxID=190721 RepID=A0AAC9BH40_9RALS|nr:MULTISPECIES: DUF4062 domain-containing protein [Ralstonia]ANH73988.1 hypothetical protein ACS15_3256 [Ralstonia insidiosa]EPX94907.1 hypothetical protein C404_26740 [Ralstonia sp. AU12-08]MBY4708373.1 DUF4062 domain-containing protein [Ralstonia insidiosa]GAQ28237.1 hypothetical protein SAMD00023378_1920 [Ralstonia sp. NT80]